MNYFFNELFFENSSIYLLNNYRYENAYEKPALPQEDIALINRLLDSILPLKLYIQILRPFCRTFMMVFLALGNGPFWRRRSVSLMGG